MKFKLCRSHLALVSLDLYCRFDSSWEDDEKTTFVYVPTPPPKGNQPEGPLTDHQRETRRREYGLITGYDVLDYSQHPEECEQEDLQSPKEDGMSKNGVAVHDPTGRPEDNNQLLLPQLPTPSLSGTTIVDWHTPEKPSRSQQNLDIPATQNEEERDPLHSESPANACTALSKDLHAADDCVELIQETNTEDEMAIETKKSRTLEVVDNRSCDHSPVQTPTCQSSSSCVRSLSNISIISGSPVDARLSTDGTPYQGERETQVETPIISLSSVSPVTTGSQVPSTTPVSHPEAAGMSTSVEEPVGVATCPNTSTADSASSPAPAPLGSSSRLDEVDGKGKERETLSKLNFTC